jgi:Flp pilus assembly protein TadG
MRHPCFFVARSNTLKKKRRRGAATIEFAVTASVMFAMLFGLIELGRALMCIEMMTEAARRACRVAVVEGTTSTQIKQAATSFLSSVGINAENVGVSVNDQPVDSVDPSSMPSTTDMTVIVTATGTNLSWVPNTLFTSGTLKGQFTMRRE